MPLTFPGAEAVVESIHQELRAAYPLAIPPCINFQNEPAGDFGIAHFYGLDRSTPTVCDMLLTFDEDRIPARYVVCHELGHAISLNVTLKRGLDPFLSGLYQEFWEARSFASTAAAPHTPLDAQNLAIQKDQEVVNGGYRYWPEENFADAFGAVASGYGQGTLITNNYGAYLDENRLRTFYKSLEGLYAMLSDEEMTTLAMKVSNIILPELLKKIDSGFNNTLPILLNRLAHGDKDVRTEPVDG